MRASTALPSGPPGFRLDVAASRSPLALPAGPPGFTGRRPGRDFFMPSGRPMLRPALGRGPEGLGLARLEDDSRLGVVVEAAAVVGAVVAIASAVSAYSASRQAEKMMRHKEERYRQAGQIVNEAFAPFATPARSAEDLKGKLMTPMLSLNKGEPRYIRDPRTGVATGGTQLTVRATVPVYAVLWDLARASGILGQLPRFARWAQELGLSAVPTYESLADAQWAAFLIQREQHMLAQARAQGFQTVAEWEAAQKAAEEEAVRHGSD